MGLNGSAASRWMKAKLVMLTFGLSLSVSLLAQEITPGNVVSAESPAALQLTEEERLWLKEHPTVRVAVKNGWMPVEFQLENQKHKGEFGQHYVCVGIKGERWLVEKSIFESTYEAVK